FLATISHITSPCSVAQGARRFFFSTGNKASKLLSGLADATSGQVHSQHNTSQRSIPANNKNAPISSDANGTKVDAAEQRMSSDSVVEATEDLKAESESNL